MTGLKWLICRWLLHVRCRLASDRRVQRSFNGRGTEPLAVEQEGAVEMASGHFWAKGLFLGREGYILHRCSLERP